MKRTHLYPTLGVLLVVAGFAVSAWFRSELPERVPIHWNYRGDVDGYGSRDSVFMGPGVMTFLFGILLVVPWISPRPFSVDRFKSTFQLIMLLTIALIGYLQGVILYATFHPAVAIGRWLVGGVMLFLAAIGNFMGKIERNLYMGIRTPWTLASDRVWNDTHRLGAWMLTGGGLLGAVFCVVGLPVWSAFIPFGAAVIAPIVYSYIHFKALEKRGEPGEAESV